MNDEVQIDESTARYIKSSNHIRKQEPFIKWQAFKPELWNSQWELSIFRIDSLSNQEIHTLGVQFVAGGNQEIIKGWGNLTVKQYANHGLRVVSEKSTHERHALSLGWTGDDADHMAVAQKLSADAKLERAQ